MTQTTRWSPDTCACVHEYTWDDSVPAASRIHTAGKVVHQCAAHMGLSVAAHFNALMDENPRKNITIGTIFALVPTLTIDDVAFFYDASRVLNITCPKLTTAQKTNLQSQANTKFGVGKVLFL